jgi:hypothetical protein
MKKEIRHYAVAQSSDYVAACGAATAWSYANLWILKRKVTCKRCRKTKAFKTQAQKS